jgi:hypothetical protein
MLDEIGRLNDRRMLVGRPEGAEASVDLAGVSSDGFEVKGKARFVVRVAKGEERVVMQELMGGGTRPVLRTGEVAAAWEDRVRAAFEGKQKRMAQDWLAAADDIRANIAKAAGSAAYVCGLEIVGEVRLAVESPGWAAWCETERRRVDRERVEAQRVERARRMGEVISELRGKGVAGGETLAKLGADDGQAVLLAALGTEGGQVGGARLWCASGTSVAELTRAGSVRAVELGAELGPVRSVFPDGDELLVGARDGVWVVRGGERKAYRDAPMVAEHGFSTVIRSGDFIVGSHRQRGVVWWRHAAAPVEGGAAVPALPPEAHHPAADHHPAGFVRPAAPWGPWTGLADRACGKVLAGGMGLEEMAVSGERRSLGSLGARCVLLAEVDGVLAAVCEDGVVRTFELADLRPVREVRVGEPITSAALMPWVGGTRILCATGSAIVAVGVDDPVVVRYLSGHKGVKEVAGGKGVVVGISPDRMRAIIWDAWTPHTPAAEIHIGTTTRSRVSDVAIA